MKKIICYGDSNTYGYNPDTGGRYGKNHRWTGLLSKILGSEYRVIEEGCNNRTGFHNNTDGIKQSGQLYLRTCLKEYFDSDIFIYALGTNDLQKFYDFNSYLYYKGLDESVKMIKEYSNCKNIFIIPPVLLGDIVLTGHFSYQFDKESIKKSNIVQEIYERFSIENDIPLIDINKYVNPSCTDGLHYTKESHLIIAEKISEYIIKYT